MSQGHLCVLLIIRACHWAEEERQCLCSANSACAEVIENINCVSKASKCVAHHSRMPLGEADQQCLCSANSAWAELIINSNSVKSVYACRLSFAHAIGVKLTSDAYVQQILMELR